MKAYLQHPLLLGSEGSVLFVCSSVLAEDILVRYIAKKDIFCNAVPNLEALKSHKPSISESNIIHSACLVPTASD